jgi:hypothetical protein
MRANRDFAQRSPGAMFTARARDQFLGEQAGDIRPAFTALARMP